MGSFWKALAVVGVVSAAPLAAQAAQFPASEQGRLAAAFLAAVNSPDEDALIRFQESNFSDAALKRRSLEQRQALARQLRDQAGTLTLEAIRSASDNQLVAIARAGNLPPNQRLTITFTFTSGSPPKIDQVQIS